MDTSTRITGRVTPWNKGKLLGQKPPLKCLIHVVSYERCDQWARCVADSRKFCRLSSLQGAALRQDV